MRGRRAQPCTHDTLPPASLLWDTPTLPRVDQEPEGTCGSPGSLVKPLPAPPQRCQDSRPLSRGAGKAWLPQITEG